MKKARKWLDQHGVDYQFHDFKKLGLEESTLRGWVAQVGWETLLNRRGMMWRKLPQEIKDTIDEKSAIRLMLETPTIIKRPVLELDGKVCVGFKEQEYQGLFGRL
jgi:arsenate reductase